MQDYRIQDETLCHFLSSTIVEWLPLFTRPVNQDIIIESLRYCQNQKGLIIHGWVLMPDHIHLLARAEKGRKLSGIMRDFKRFTSIRLNESIQQNYESRRNWMRWISQTSADQYRKNIKYKIWQEGLKAIPMERNRDMDVKLNYIHQNPVKQNFVRKAQDWMLSSAIDYCGGKGLLDIEHLSAPLVWV